MFEMSFYFFFADKILVATGLPHTSMVEIINFASPKLSWNFEATSQKKFLERSGCIGAVLQKQAHIYGGFKKIDNENPNGIEKEYIKGILEREKQKHQEFQERYPDQVIDFDDDERSPDFMIYNNGFIIGRSDINVQNMVKRRRYASSIIVDTGLLITGGESEDCEYSEIKLSSTEFIKGCSDNPIIGPDYLFGDHGLNEHGMVQYDESSIYVIGGYEGCTDSPTDETWIINPLNNFKKKIGPMLKTMRSKHCCGKMYTKNGSKILLVVAGGVDISYPHLIKSVEILDPTSDQGWIEGML